ncbi:2-oxoglutarate dehydrogenase complex dihydrolipoyllysine-residue succinyltransferase [Bartonella sp. HY329]|uniref:2-oxoglutarate dehydrogenase complex dihydrolipoyllysine-residue succinyltransferase n=1 Tax=unclassified Bartonella TaxID=2645622 RepID=UPI0021C8AFBD|nr:MULTISPECIES: 2-oxoglutarate dehydrogenase complex dihydrolipoyllysine-residue succinyltransferase [unclassified Bartonella]UXM94918.1 2-oxoglutarate dehydrogenase complex dihydrolipoyllysine-residue succinyltransferase [Bartonella sp. HY329]UXN09241.1 2-oxoglutarate dehydrogenase complex dihydrolipoyllysine-residue succinyltransferase [Bartonella sp. HY328]
MATEIRVPTLGESVTEATIGKWYKQPGESVSADEPLVELETDKVTVDVPAPASGKLGDILAKEGDTVEVGALLGTLIEGAEGSAPAAPKVEAAAPAPAAPAAPTVTPASSSTPPAPSAAKLMAENNLSASQVDGSGKRGQVLKGDVLDALSKPSAAASAPVVAAPRAASAPDDESREERVRMTKLRQTIAKRLKEVQNTAAMLTTFNEVDMSAVMELRKRYRDVFEKKHGVKLGFMGFFTKAVCHALKEVPAINAEIDGTDIIYKNYAHVGIAVGTDKGLVVPVVRDADQMSIAQIEKEIGRLGRLARDSKLGIADMRGGTFTITNGGIYGSLMSTPIINAPQSAILGMHAIKERPIAVNGQVVIRPMMYLAVSYDHRIVDGAEAVTFLVRIKESLEDPERLVLDL